MITGGMDYEEIKKKLKTIEFRDLIRNKVRNGLGLYKSNPDLIIIVSDFLGVPEYTLTPIWDRVFKLVLKIYHGKVKVRSSGNVGRVHVNSLANSLYFILYEKYGSDTISVMYDLLEPYMVPVLSGEGDYEKVRLFFLPISTSNVESVMNLFREVLESKRDVFCSIPLVMYYVICSQSSLLPTSSTGRGGVETCVSKLKKIYREVCGSG